MSDDLTLPCPRCQTPVIYDVTSPWRPFCSERCKLIDLGDWAAERHTIPDTDRPDFDESF